jgi:hypothetical protein
MFISKKDLQQIRDQIAFLQDLASKFQSEIIQLRVAQEKAQPMQKIDEGWTPEKRARHSVFMKKSWADRKARMQA